MRSPWHKWWLLALLASACGLNPQPDLPGNGAPPSSAGGTTSAGTDGEGAGGLSIGWGGSTAGGPSLPTAGDRGVDSGDAGTGGDSGSAGEAGSAGMSGAAGYDGQLAPGPTM